MLLLISGCATSPDCQLATEGNGWSVINNPPASAISTIAATKSDSDEVIVWLKNIDGRIARCSHPSGVTHCASSLYIAVPKDKGYEQGDIVVTTCGMPY